MTTAEIGKDLVELCGTGQFLPAIEKHYSSDIVSVEAGGPAPTASGIDAIRGKQHWWAENFTFHSAEVTGPFVNGDQFVVHFTLDLTPKATGVRTTAQEIGLYTVRDGKIVHEAFFALAE